MSETMEPATISKWLASQGYLDATLMRISINGQSWEAFQCHQVFVVEERIDDLKPGDIYHEKAIFCLGDIPQGFKPPGSLECYTHDGFDWRVMRFTSAVGSFTPFGPYFVLKPWTIPESTFDEFELVKYRRVPMQVEIANTSPPPAAYAALVGKEFIAAETGKNRGLAVNPIKPWKLGHSIGQLYLASWTDNPYPEGTEDYAEWRAGFKAAQDEKDC